MNDYISRQTAIDALMNDIEPFVIVEPGTTCVIGAGIKDSDVIKMLEAMPSADVQPVRHGRWLDGNKNQPCSVCKYRGKKSWNYCPNCGARMDGE